MSNKTTTTKYDYSYSPKHFCFQSYFAPSRMTEIVLRYHIRTFKTEGCLTHFFRVRIPEDKKQQQKMAKSWEKS